MTEVLAGRAMEVPEQQAEVNSEQQVERAPEQQAEHGSTEEDLRIPRKARESTPRLRLEARAGITGSRN